MGLCESKGSLIDIVSFRIGCRETSALSLICRGTKAKLCTVFQVSLDWMMILVKSSRLMILFNIGFF